MVKLKQRILIDCDPGHDDAIAIFLACSRPDVFDIIGVSTVAGNQTLAKVTENARQILALIKSDIPLVQGASSPLVKPHAVSYSAHGESGMDGPMSKNVDYPLQPEHAVAFIYKKLMESETPVTLVALGPLTNIALLIKTFPEILPKIAKISLMGGGISKGNATAAAEFNIFIDPEAAKIVYESGIEIIMAGLDVTEAAYITVDEFSKLKGQGLVSQYVYELLVFYNKAGRQFGFEHSAMHDACAIAVLCNPELFTGTIKKVSIVVEEGLARGMTLADNRQITRTGSDVYVLETVQRNDFVELITNACAILDATVK